MIHWVINKIKKPLVTYIIYDVYNIAYYINYCKFLIIDHLGIKQLS